MEYLTPNDRDRLKGWIVSGILPLGDLRLRDRDYKKWASILSRQVQHVPHGKPVVIHLEFSCLSELDVLALLDPFKDQKVVALHCHRNQIQGLRSLHEWFHVQMVNLNEVHLSHNLLCTPEILDLLQISCVQNAKCTWLRVEQNFINRTRLLQLWRDMKRKKRRSVQVEDTGCHPQHCICCEDTMPRLRMKFLRAQRAPWAMAE